MSPTPPSDAFPGDVPAAAPASDAVPMQLQRWLEAAASQQISWAELAERVLQHEQAELRAAHRPDRDRGRRCGFSEVIYGAGKSADDVIHIARRLLDHADSEVLVTRFDPRDLPRVAKCFQYVRFDCLAKTLRIAHSPIQEVRSSPANQIAPPALPSSALSDSALSCQGIVAVVTAGSTDLPVAREAIETLRWMRLKPDIITDVGVAGPYRLLAHLEQLRQACALVVVAGMEGALASVVGGLVACPVIAVPTSVGYGANLNGITTLLSMLSSCAAGVTTVNIDGGFKGGYVAGLIAHRVMSAAR